MSVVPVRSDCRRAFTLMELMVVLALIAILSAMILPEMRGTLEGAVLRASARQLIGVFGLANSRAVSLRQPHRVRIDPSSGKFFLETQPSRSARGGPFVAVHEGSEAEGKLDHRVTISLRQIETPTPGLAVVDGARARLDGVTFYPDGTADSAEILLEDRAGFGLALRLNPVTARTQIVERSRR